MTPLPPPLGDGALAVWRLDMAIHAATWDSGAGARRVGGRWNSPGVSAVYCSLNPATAILEVAVHKGFPALDLVPHVLTAATIAVAAQVHIVAPDTIPDPDWLRPGLPTARQQAFGDQLLRRHRFALLPSVVSSHSWNMIFTAGSDLDAYRLSLQEPFVLDPRLHTAAG